MAKLFKGRLPAEHREMTIIEIEGGETIRTWDAGLSLRQAWRLAFKKAGAARRYTVRNVICDDGGRGQIVRELRALEGGYTYAAGEIPMNYR